MAKSVVNKVGDVRAKSDDQLKELVLELRREQFNLRFQRATGQQEGIGRIREARREIARAKTVMSERTRAAAKA
ncbi:50S ribosomal protein L29 [Acidisphaera rubrifaciens]|uniref:Large ribosomal subunit protein uL29 n=1 Tax=Acidisphaera rubrifaciens HS-AP3 TaxID=1231350 RepID=A0A0D6P4W0_9PROT|nr:50S ribosomal protein L29 [Acidisphaera rubrifaciens]GAN76228.1 50S ribosomal protein L29 [Acidisphaera rubrifaciens HS-AP3]